MVIKLGSGLIYAAPQEEYEVGIVAPAFHSDQDAKTWRDLVGLKFKEITVTVSDMRTLKKEARDADKDNQRI